ncbi:MAG: peptidoglycan editing factor PgeF [Deferribacteres bacterium]|nr:peptidoglycan editing factor PgeF [Deferribacteres bacterium]
MKVIEPPNIEFPDTRAFFTGKLPPGKDIYEIVSGQCGISRDSIYLPVQRHTTTAYVLETESERVVADAVITGRKGVLIGVLVADCVPVLLYDPLKRVAGAVHAGWRGTAGGILKGTVRAMQERFGCSAGDILAAIGPSIRGCCYEVGEDVRAGIQEATGSGDYFRRHGDKYLLDLATANKIQAVVAGIPGENIWQAGECTFCNPDKFHSYRYTKGTAGRQGGFIGIW